MGRRGESHSSGACGSEVLASTSRHWEVEPLGENANLTLFLVLRLSECNEERCLGRKHIYRDDKEELLMGVKDQGVRHDT